MTKCRRKPSPEYKRGLRAALTIAEMFADENMRMAMDTVRCDPILNRDLRQRLSSIDELNAASKVSDQLGDEGHAYSARSHCASDIAEAIRAEMKKV